MEIVNFGHFQRSSVSGLMTFANADGQDWYEVRRALTSWGPSGEFVDAIYGAWIGVDPVTSEVLNVEFDPSRLVPDNKVILGVDADYATIIRGQLFTGAGFANPPEPPLVYPPLPRSVFWLAALEAGVTKANILLRIAALPDGVDRERKRIMIEETMQYRRDDPDLSELALAEGIAPAQLDALWLSAANGG